MACVLFLLAAVQVSKKLQPWWVDSGWPWLSDWLQSPGFAGVAAVVAASIAFAASRRQARLNAWWERAEWALTMYVSRDSSPSEREVGIATIGQLQDSALGGKAEQGFLAAVVDATTLDLIEGDDAPDDLVR